MKIHYIYKITLLKGSLENCYYLGKKSSRVPKYLQGGNIQKYVIENPMFDNYSGSGSIPINYFNKYGKILGETFLKEIILFSEDSYDNCLNEELIIADKYKTDPLCVNLVKGGQLNPALLGHKISRSISLESRMKNSQKHKKLWKQDSYRNKVIAGIREFYKVCNSPNIGKKMSQEQKELLSQINLGHKNEKNAAEGNGMYQKIPKNAKSVLQYDKEGNFIKEWKSAAEAKKCLGIDNITIVCNGKRKYAGGYIWKWGENNYSTDAKKVCQYSLDNQLINTYSSAWEAAKLLNLDSSSIYKVCQGKGKTCGGFKWKFLNDNK